MTSSVSQNNTQCIENPTGEVSLNVAVRGIPGPEGPQGPKGDIGPRGEIGLKGDRGVQGEKGDRGDIGPVGPKALKGDKGIKGQKGARGIQGIPGPPGSPGLVGSQGIRGSPGHEGPQGPIGPPGQPGQTGPRGPQGEPGDTVLTEKEFNLLTNSVQNSVLDDVNGTVTNKFDDICKKVDKLNNSVLQAMQSGDQELLDIVMAKLEAMNETLNMLKSGLPNTKCGISSSWRRIANFDTTQGDSCPIGLRTVTNSITFQKACGRTNRSAGCASFKFHNSMSYTNICGRVRGYQENSPECFYHNVLTNKRIDDPYANGILITQGSPRKHIWSYVAGASEATDYVQGVHLICPCARSTPSITSSDVPNFVGTHYYCESGHNASNIHSGGVIWEDPLWDGQGCHNSGNQCCNRYGWFHRQVQASSEYIELRICADQTYTNEDIPIDQFEIWVM